MRYPCFNTIEINLLARLREARSHIIFESFIHLLAFRLKYKFMDKLWQQQKIFEREAARAS